MYATDKQIALISTLAAKKGMTAIAAADAYGLGLQPARDLSRADASELIDWLLGKPTPGAERITQADRDAGDERRRAFLAKYNLTE